MLTFYINRAASNCLQNNAGAWNRPKTNFDRCLGVPRSGNSRQASHVACEALSHIIQAVPGKSHGIASAALGLRTALDRGYIWSATEEPVMSFRSMCKTKSIAMKSAELAFAVPQVVAHRLTRMAQTAPVLSARDRKEFDRMVVEKGAAFVQAWQAMAVQTVLANQAMAASFVRSFWSVSARGRITPAKVAAQLQGAALGVLHRGLAPVHRKATANARRLARTKLR